MSATTLPSAADGAPNTAAPKFAVVGIGNALVDVIAHASEEFLDSHDLNKGSMTLVETDRAVELYAALGTAVEMSGGSAANTMVGVASLGGTACYIGKVNHDDLGDVFGHDMRAVGVPFHGGGVDHGTPTGRCIIVVTPDAERTILGHGLPASPGAVSGAVVFSADEAERRAQAGDDVILVRIETSPEDIHGMHAARGILTSRGGMTSHAAVVARGMGRPCVAGAGDIRIDYDLQQFYAGETVVRVGETITLDGATGEIMAGRVPTLDPEVSGEFALIMGWADEIRRLGVRANAETPADADTARQLGAEGIGLCRTEHMFFDADRIIAMREMIVAEDEAGRRLALEKLLLRRMFATT